MSKTEADNVISFSIRDLRRMGFLNGCKSGNISWTFGQSENKSVIGITTFTSESSSFIRLYYTQTESDGTKNKFDYEISLVKTLCNYGGHRFWFLCRCGKRVGSLYKDGDYFACRHCYDLTYKSRNENRRYKLYPLFTAMGLTHKIDYLQSKIKRSYYAGMPTKKQRQLDKLIHRTAINNRLL